MSQVNRPPTQLRSVTGPEPANSALIRPAGHLLHLAGGGVDFISRNALRPVFGTKTLQK